MRKLHICYLFLILFSSNVYAQWQSILNTEGVVFDEKREYLNAKGDIVTFISDNFLYVSKDTGNHWLRHQLPFTLRTDIDQSFQKRLFSILTTSKGIYLWYRPYDSDSIYIYHSINFGERWSIYRDKVSDIGYPTFSLFGDDVYLLYIKLIKDDNILFRCVNGENSWRVENKYPTSLRSLGMTKKYEIYIKGAKINGDTLVVADKLTGRILAERNLNNFKTEILSYSDSIILIKDDYTVYNTENLKPFNDFHFTCDGDPILNTVVIGKGIYNTYKNNIRISKDSIQTCPPISDNIDPRLIITSTYYSDSIFYARTEYDIVYRLKLGERVWQKCNTYGINELLFYRSSGLIKLTNNLYVNNRYGISSFNSNSDIYTKGNGLVWERFPPLSDYGYYRSWVKDSTYYVIVGDGLSNTSRKVYKFSSVNTSWEQVPTPDYTRLLPFGEHYQFVGDTLIYMYQSTIQYAVPPYLDNTIKTVANDVYFRDAQLNGKPYKQNFYFYYQNGILYYPTQPNGIVQKKLSGEYANLNVFGYLPSPISNIYFKNNKIFYKYINNIYRSLDGGKTFETIFNTDGRSSFMGFNLHFLMLSNGVLLASTEADSTCCDNYQKKGGIYASLDEGNTWFQVNENLNSFVYVDQPNNGLRNGLPSMILTQIGDYVYGGTWRRHIDDFKNKSISGTIYFDENNNGIKNDNEKPLSNVPLIPSNGANLVTSDSSGFYYLPLEDKAVTDTISFSLKNITAKARPSYYLLKKGERLVDKNFGVYFPVTTNDIQINITNLTPPRYGFKSLYFIDYKNIGSTTLNGRITLKYDRLQRFDSASMTPTSNLNNTILWDYVDLKPFENRKIAFTLTTNNLITIGSKITNIVQIDPINIDTIKSNNVDTLIQNVVGSYDPNDKQVTFNNSKIPPSVIDPSTELIYTIRFQNTGNYPAGFVKITDTLSDKLDVSTFRMIAASHDYTVNIRNKNVLVFDFNPIYLPDSIRDEKGSHGFVKFAIKPKRALSSSEAIKNTGFIYFDYNPAIVTNTVETANLKASGIFTPSVSAEKLNISPNPAQQSILIEIDNPDFREGQMSIYDLSGRLILSKTIFNKNEVLNIAQLKSGEYICTIKSNDNKIFVNKFVKVE